LIFPPGKKNPRGKPADTAKAGGEPICGNYLEAHDLGKKRRIGKLVNYPELTSIILPSGSHKDERKR